jgi:hypothetical protein
MERFRLAKHEIHNTTVGLRSGSRSAWPSASSRAPKASAWAYIAVAFSAKSERYLAALSGFSALE